MSTETQGLPLWDIFLAGDSTLPAEAKIVENKSSDNSFNNPQNQHH